LAHGDFANAGVAARATTTDLALTQAISRRWSLSASYTLRRTTFGQPDLGLASQNGLVRLNYRLSRYVSLRTGYGMQTANYSFAQAGAVRGHDLDLGLDYSRALSVSRRTTVAFSSGSSAVDQGASTAFVLKGDATLTRLIGRTWNARVAVKRDVQLLDGFAHPVLANSITTSVGGGLTRRTSVSSSIGFSSGRVGVAQSAGNAYSNWTVSSGLGMVLSRRSAFEAQYFYYGHRFGQEVLLASGLAKQQLRQGVRVGITWQAPLLH